MIFIFTEAEYTADKYMNMFVMERFLLIKKVICIARVLLWLPPCPVVFLRKTSVDNLAA